MDIHKTLKVKVENRLMSQMRLTLQNTLERSSSLRKLRDLKNIKLQSNQPSSLLLFG